MTDTMNRVRKLKKIFGKDFVFSVLSLLRFIPDPLFLRLEYRFLTGEKLNLKNPVLFNEKLQYLKLHDRKPVYTRMADKYGMRSFVKEKTGRDLTVPLLGVWKRPQDIDFSSLPSSFVLKCNHDSKGLVICRSRENFDSERAVKFLSKSLRRNMYRAAREWPYKDIVPCIICEPFLENIREYQFLCFNGQPRIMYVPGQNEAGGLTEDFFDMDFRSVCLSMGYPKSGEVIEKPDCFEEMKSIAAVLSAGCPHLRVDFIVCDSVLYVGELTFYNDAGFAPVSPRSMSREMGSWIVI